MQMLVLPLASFLAMVWQAGGMQIRKRLLVCVQTNAKVVKECRQQKDEDEGEGGVSSSQLRMSNHFGKFHARA